MAVVLADGGVDAGFPTDPTPDDPDPPPDAGVSHVDQLLELAWSDDDFDGLQNENGWSYGYWSVDVTPGRDDPSAPGDVTDPGAGSGLPGALESVPGPFRELPVWSAAAPFEPGDAWTRGDGGRWLYVARGGAHPWGPVTVGGADRDELWAVRRWRAPRAGNYFVYVEATARVGQEGCNFGDGTRVSVWRGQVRIATIDVPPAVDGYAMPVKTWANAVLGPLDTLDVAVEPRGNDVCDGTRTRIGVYEKRAFD